MRGFYLVSVWLHILAAIRLQSTESFAEARTLPNSTEFDYPGSMTPDGRTIIFYRSSPATSLDVLVAPIEDPGRATPLVQTAAYEAGARLSSDGRWLIYVANESGRNEIYVRAFSGPERRRQVSTDGGSQPTWHPNGNEIFYRIGDRVMSVAVTHVGDELQLSAPRELFAPPVRLRLRDHHPQLRRTKDGRFVMVRDDTTVGRLRVILNWRLDAATPAPAR